MIKFGNKITYVNSVLVRGQLIGVFYSHVYYARLGSKRAILEQIWKRYEPETDIEIVVVDQSSIPTILED